MTISTTLKIQRLKSTASSKNLQILAAALLGMVILLAVGFAPMEIAHNAAHDTRHSVAFPCH